MPLQKTMLVLLAVALCACSDPEQTEPQAPNLTIEWGRLQVDSGVEGNTCVVKRLGNPDEIFVKQVHNTLGPAHHHLIVHLVDDAVERPEPFACPPFANTMRPGNGKPLVISQKADDVLTFPDGVGMRIAANQMVRLELHYVNTAAEPVTTHASSTFVAMDERDVVHEADLMFIGEVDIDLPAMRTTLVGPSDIRLPDSHADASFFAFTGHTHRLGSNVIVATASPTRDDEVVYAVDDFDWDEPETVIVDPPVQLRDGGSFRFSCSFDNTSKSKVAFGEDHDEEMCFFWTYYYPSRGAQICFVHSGFDVSACCPGSPICDTLFAAE